MGYKLFLIKIEEEYFEDAPVTKQYPREMYYRLLAPCFLPDRAYAHPVPGSGLSW